MNLTREAASALMPKRLLALDTGGVRGVITLEVLERVESIVRAKPGQPNAVLADYIDSSNPAF